MGALILATTVFLAYVAQVLIVILTSCWVMTTLTRHRATRHRRRAAARTMVSVAVLSFYFGAAGRVAPWNVVQYLDALKAMDSAVDPLFWSNTRMLGGPVLLLLLSPLARFFPINRTVQRTPWFNTRRLIFVSIVGVICSVGAHFFMRESCLPRGLDHRLMDLWGFVPACVLPLIVVDRAFERNRRMAND